MLLKVSSNRIFCSATSGSKSVCAGAINTSFFLSLWRECDATRHKPPTSSSRKLVLHRARAQENNIPRRTQERGCVRDANHPPSVSGTMGFRFLLQLAFYYYLPTQGARAHRTGGEMWRQNGCSARGVKANKCDAFFSQRVAVYCGSSHTHEIRLEE